MGGEWHIGDIVAGGLSSYRLEDDLSGDGAQLPFGAVDVNSGKKYFLKIYEAEPRKTNPRFDIFWKQQEAVIARLKNIADYTEIFREHFLIEDLYYCSVKEFLEGKNLRKLIEEDLEDLTPVQSVGLAVVFIGVLKAIHGEEICHTDLKPEQVFVVKDPCELGWRLKICDFDAALVPGIEPFGIYTTAFYSSPEHIRNEPITPASDVFTAGIVLCEMLTGAAKGATFVLGKEEDSLKEYEENVLVHRVNTAVYQAIRDNYKSGDILVDIIDRMLEPDAVKRPTAEEAHRALFDAFGLESGKEEKEGESEEEKESEGEVEPPAAPPRILRLAHADGRIVVFEDERVIGRNDFRRFGRENYKYAEHNQFKVQKTDKGWEVSGFSDTTNPTLLNGEDIRGKSALLKGGETLQVGPLVFDVQVE